MTGSLQKKGNKWYVVVNKKDESGKWNIQWIKTGESKKPEAQKKMVEILHQLNNNIFVQPEKITFGEFIKEWLDDYAKTNTAITTYEGYKTIINKYIVPKLGNILLQKLTPIDIQKYYKYLIEEKKLSNNTIYRHHANIRKALDYALKMQIVIRNVSDVVELPKKKKFTPKVYNSDKVLELIEKAKDDRFEVVINLAIGLGIRLSEICGLKWENVNFKDNTISIEQARVRVKKNSVEKSPKSEAGRRVLKVEEQLMKLLKVEQVLQIKEKLKAGDAYFKSDYVVRNREDGKILSPSTISHSFQKFLKRNNLPIIRLHDLRHTNITLMLRGNVNIRVVQKRAGHSNIQTTLGTYAHVLDDMEQTAVNNIIYQAKQAQ